MYLELVIAFIHLSNVNKKIEGIFFTDSFTIKFSSKKIRKWYVLLMLLIKRWLLYYMHTFIELLYVIELGNNFYLLIINVVFKIEMMLFFTYFHKK